MGLDMTIYRESRPGLATRGDQELAYWRKHPNLHGFIVRNFADGTDDCQPIGLTAENIRTIIKASQEGKLPETSGFFFGETTPEKVADGIKQLHMVLDAMEADPTMRVYYQASW